jgi:hypothetical protein
MDVLTITASSSSRIAVLRIEATLITTQYTTFPALGLQLMSGSTGTSTGTAITPVNVLRRSNNKAADFTATGPSSTVVSTASAALIVAGGLDPLRWVYAPSDLRQPILGLSGILFLRTTVPSVAAVLSVSATVQELGKGLPT